MKAILLLAVAASACSTDENSIVEKLQPGSNSQQSYTLTITASMGANESLTRALSIDGSGSKNVLQATWTAGDEVSVYNYSKHENVGTLVAQEDGITTTLKGELTGSIETNDLLILSFCSDEYDSQDGTLEYIAQHCDYATADLFVYGVIDNEVFTGDQKPTFQNQQAIIRFSLTNKADDASLNAGTLKYTMTAFHDRDNFFGERISGVIADHTFNISANAAQKNGAGVLFFAIPGPYYFTIEGHEYSFSYGDEFDLALTATVGSDTYHYVKSDCTCFQNGNYYEVNVKMLKMWDGNLAKLTSASPSWHSVATDGMTVYGTLNADAQNVQISIADGATVTLDNANINATTGIKCEGDATIVLNNNNIVNVSRDFGIYVPENKTLTIQGEGSLEITNQDGPCIGGLSGVDAANCGNIVINGGTITATASGECAIGAGYNKSCGDITINGGNVTIVDAFVGIGCYQGTCGDITITGGTVIVGNKATNSYYFYYGIGAYPHDGCCGDILITGGTVDVVVQSLAIGGHCGSITVSGGTVNATGNAAAIGCHNSSYPCGDITFSGGIINAKSNNNKCIIGQGNITITDDMTKFVATSTYSDATTIECDGTITIAGKDRGHIITLNPYIYEHATIDLSTVTDDVSVHDANTLTGKLNENVKVSIDEGATVTLSGVDITNGNNSSSNLWAGITCNGDATIKLIGDNKVKSFYDYTIPSITFPANKTLIIQGPGKLTAENGIYGEGNIIIEGGVIDATGIGDYNYPAIGGTGNITITGGTITATGKNWAPGIGSAAYKTCGDITITEGVTMVTATKENCTYSIGCGAEGKCGIVTIGGIETGQITDSPYTYTPSH